MKKKITVLFALLSIAGSLFAAFDPAYSDRLFYKEGDFRAEEEYLADALENSTDPEERAAILWRQSRNQLTQGDFIPKEDKDARFEAYEKAAILADASRKEFDNPDAYHWMSSAMGRWGQTKGIFESLKQAPGMQDFVLEVLDRFGYDYTDSWYVLGLLYNQLPGKPLSFGNKTWAVSYMRKSLDTRLDGRGLYLTNFIELADQLWDRNWDTKKRGKEYRKMDKEWNDTMDEPLSVHCRYYEGRDRGDTTPFYSTVPLSKMTDRQEAVLLMRYADRLYSTVSDPKPALQAQKEEIDRRLSDWT